MVLQNEKVVQPHVPDIIPPKPGDLPIYSREEYIQRERERTLEELGIGAMFLLVVLCFCMMYFCCCRKQRSIFRID